MWLAVVITFQQAYNRSVKIVNSSSKKTGAQMIHLYFPMVSRGEGFMSPASTTLFALSCVVILAFLASGLSSSFFYASFLIFFIVVRAPVRVLLFHYNLYSKTNLLINLPPMRSISNPFATE